MSRGHATTPTPEFVMAGAEDKPLQVTGIAALDAYLVRYIDNDSKPQTRICYHVPETETVYVIQQRISGVPVVVDGTSWFSKAFVKRLGQIEQEQEGIQSV